RGRLGAAAARRRHAAEDRRGGRAGAVQAVGAEEPRDVGGAGRADGAAPPRSRQRRDDGAHVGADGGHAKKRTPGPSEAGRPDVQQARASFQGWAGAVDPRRLIFLDEFGANLGMTRLYGYAPRGQRAYGAAPENTDPNLTLVFGLELKGLVAPVVF